MNAQEIWLTCYIKWYNAIHRHLTKTTIRSRRAELYRFRREAALERIIARKQRTIADYSQRTEDAEARVAQLEAERDTAIAQAVADEREACAKIGDQLSRYFIQHPGVRDKAAAESCKQYAAAIRDRSSGAGRE